MAEVLGEVAKLTPGDVAAFAKAYLVDSNRTVVTLAAKEDKK